MDSYTVRSTEPESIDSIKETKRMYPKLGNDPEPVSVTKSITEKETEKSVSIVVEEDEKTGSDESVQQQEDSKQEVQHNEPTPGSDAPIIMSYHNDITTNQTSFNETKCCSTFKASLQQCGPLYWYLAPITFDLGYSISCFFYHWFSFIFALAVWIFLVTCLCTFVPLMILACVGIPLLYITFEIVILLSRLSFYMNYYLVENDKELFKPENKWKLKMRVDNKNLPKWKSYCTEGMRFSRFKFMFTTLPVYGYIIYHLIISPIMVLLTGLSTLPVLYSINFMIYIFWYPSDTHYFKNKNQCYYTKSGWCITTAEDVVLCFFLGLVTLPICFKLCSFMAQQSKKVNYWVMTNYYNQKVINKGLLDKSKKSNYGNNNDSGINSNVLYVSDESGIGSINNSTVSNTGNTVSDMIERSGKDINEFSNTKGLEVTEKNLYENL